jgi:hypothetical protein
MKLPPRNLTHEKGFPTIVSARALPNFLKIFILHLKKKVL